MKRAHRLRTHPQPHRLYTQPLWSRAATDSPPNNSRHLILSAGSGQSFPSLLGLSFASSRALSTSRDGTETASADMKDRVQPPALPGRKTVTAYSRRLRLLFGLAQTAWVGYPVTPPAMTRPTKIGVRAGHHARKSDSNHIDLPLGTGLAAGGPKRTRYVVA